MDDRQWLLVPKITEAPDEGTRISGTVLINLNLVRRTVFVSMTEIRLFFDENNIEVIQGTAVPEVMKLLLERSLTIDGQPFVFPTSDKSS